MVGDVTEYGSEYQSNLIVVFTIETSSLVLTWEICSVTRKSRFNRHIAIACTVPFQLIRQSHVTGPYGLALILVHVTGHIDFGQMGKTLRKKALIMCATFPSIDLLWYHIWLSLLQINFLLVANSVCHRSLRKWSECQNATAMSRVTPPDESIEMVQY